jgi:hypothetical protein
MGTFAIVKIQGRLKPLSDIWDQGDFAVSNQDDLSSSLLRRLLNQDRETRAPDDDLPDHESKPTPPDAVVSPIPGHTVPAQPHTPNPDEAMPTSPIRPSVHEDSEPRAPLAPSLPDRTASQSLSPREQMQRAEEALINLREKMALVAAEFAEGKLNQAQFNAIYTRYSEQRDITERLLARDPESQAWQSVVQPGHTQFLKQHFEARVLSYAIYDEETGEQINITGPVVMKHAQIEAVLTRLKAVSQTRGDPGPAQRTLPDERCVLFMPGERSVAVVIFSRTPAPAQVARIQDIHRDFERANQHALRRRDYTGSRMVFPHRALFEEKKP